MPITHHQLNTAVNAFVYIHPNLFVFITYFSPQMGKYKWDSSERQVVTLRERVWLKERAREKNTKSRGWKQGYQL